MKPNSSRQRLERKLERNLARAVRGFQLIREGDVIMVAMSGGKDSYVLHHLLTRLAQRSPVRFSVLGVHLHQGQPGHDPTPLVDFMREHNYPFHLEFDDTYSIVTSKIAAGDTPCVLCSRFRRAVLYRLRTQLGCSTLALGHHREDAITTLFLNLIFSGQLKAMPPKLLSDDKQHVVIRPLIYCPQDDIAELAALMNFPILPCGLCGSQPNHQRKAVEALLADLDAKNPGARANILAAMANVRPSHLLDPGLWAKLGLEVALEETGLTPSNSLVRQ